MVGFLLLLVGLFVLNVSERDQVSSELLMMLLLLLFVVLLVFVWVPLLLLPLLLSAAGAVFLVIFVDCHTIASLPTRNPRREARDV